jgi:hypothetical protein
LADVNRSGQGNTYFTANGSALETNEQSTDQSSALLKFSSLTESGNVADGFQSVYICDLLSLQVAEDENGALKKVGSGGPDDEIPDAASIRVWDQTEAAFIYYGPKSSTDSGDTTYYTLTLVNALQEAYEDTADVTISEVYYLIINCEDGEGVYSRILSLGEKRITSADSKAVPTKTVTNSSRAASKYYTLGDFFEISDTSISSTSENSSAVIELGTNDYIDVEVSAKVSVAEDQAEIFKNYASGTSSYFRFALRLSDGSSFCAINATSISVEDLKIGDQTLASEDYTIEQIAGICYVTITGQTASEYQNQTVYAKLRFSYMDDSEKISEQFPERVGESDQDGIHFSVDAAIAYTKDSLDGTKMSDSDQDATYYYREKIEVVDLTYNSYNTASEDGNTSQLGINGREAAGNSGQTITSLGMFNATQLTSLNLTDREAERYPASLVCTLSLEKKTDQSDGSTKYEPVKIDTYLDDITVTSGDSSVSGAVNKNGAYGFTVLLSDEQIQNIALEQIEMDISYFVLSDAQLEAVEANGVYSNYRVTLTAYLANANGEKLAEETSDYFVYTNAKFYLGILGNSDFGN